MTRDEEIRAALEQLETLVYHFEDTVAQLDLLDQLEDAVAQLGLLSMTFQRLLQCDLMPSPDLQTPASPQT